MALVSLTPHLTPHGRLLLLREDDASLVEAELADRIQNAFGRGAGHGLLHLGANELGVALPPALSFWREFATRYVSGVCARPGGAAEAESVHTKAGTGTNTHSFWSVGVGTLLCRGSAGRPRAAWSRDFFPRGVMCVFPYAACP